eukprot:3940695-Rhodomonas_salina.2
MSTPAVMNRRRTNTAERGETLKAYALANSQPPITLCMMTYRVCGVACSQLLPYMRQPQPRTCPFENTAFLPLAQTFPSFSKTEIAHRLPLFLDPAVHRTARGMWEDSLVCLVAVSYTHLRAHETEADL